VPPAGARAADRDAVVEAGVGQPLGEDADAADLVLAMDAQNLADLGGPTDRIRLFRDFDPLEPGSDVPDPYYGGDSGFEEVLAMVERTSRALVDSLERERPWDGGAVG
jgi:protein-tyrosine phosphatase